MTDLLQNPELEAGTRRLARYLSESRYDDLPAQVTREAVRSFVNWAGCAIGGANHESVDIALATFTPFAGPAQAYMPGRRERTDCMLAALVSGIASHVLDFDDTHPDILVHPSGPVASALLSLAQYRTFSGPELINAFVAGVEVQCRVARAVMPDHYEIGWHITGTAGIIGAAAACSRLLGLDETRSAWALGIAATQAAGLREMFGSMCKSFHVGRAAQGGLAAALLAQNRFTSSETALEGSRGFIHVLSTSPSPQALCRGLGEQYELLRNTYKPFPCGLVIHPILDGCIQLRDRHRLQGPDIERVDLIVNPLAMELTGKTAPSTGLEGKFSIFHAAAVALLDGAGLEAQFSDERVVAKGVVALRSKVTARVDAALGKEQARISICLKNESRYEIFVTHCVGSLERPMSDDQLDAKFLANAQPGLGDRASVALAALRNLSQAQDVAELARLCAVGNTQSTEASPSPAFVVPAQNA